MTKHLLAMTLATGLLVSPAFADCAGDLKGIDKALQSASLSETDMAAVKKMRDDGEKLCAAGDEAEAGKLFKEVKKILKIE